MSEYDFYIVTDPHSGSHMLASALDSHPEIQCKGEVGWRDYSDTLGVNKGKVLGGITHSKAYNFTRENIKLSDVSKVIVLLRGVSDRLLDFTRGKDRIVFRYEHLTRDRHIDCLPLYASEKICTFLDVDQKLLYPTFTKNKVSTWRAMKQ